MSKTLELLHFRFSSDEDSTIGLLFLDNKFECFTCEDEFRENKVAGETRIPAGRYRILLRNEGGMTKRYAAKYPEHTGMLWLQNVPNFEWVYIHVGNTDQDSQGCILVGMGCSSEDSGGGTVSTSVHAYRRLYKQIIAAMDAGKEVWITVYDGDNIR